MVCVWRGGGGGTFLHFWVNGALIQANTSEATFRISWKPSISAGAIFEEDRCRAFLQAPETE